MIYCTIGENDKKRLERKMSIDKMHNLCYYYLCKLHQIKELEPDVDLPARSYLYYDELINGTALYKSQTLE